jgi:hypothetical protein
MMMSGALLACGTLAVASLIRKPPARRFLPYRK